MIWEENPWLKGYIFCFITRHLSTLYIILFIKEEDKKIWALHLVPQLPYLNRLNMICYKYLHQELRKHIKFNISYSTAHYIPPSVCLTAPSKARFSRSLRAVLKIFSSCKISDIYYFHLYKKKHYWANIYLCFNSYLSLPQNIFTSSTSKYKSIKYKFSFYQQADQQFLYS